MKNFRPVVIIPSYNTGTALLEKTVRSALDKGIPVKVVVDGSDDGSDRILDSLKGSDQNLTVLRKAENTGKGDALLQAATVAIDEGFTHGLMMDSDGQHPSNMIHPMLDRAKALPGSLIMGQPVFGDEAPWARVAGRKLTTFWTNIETLWCGLGDTLFGMRVYPLTPFIKAFGQTSFARGFEFDPEIAVRMTWLGCQPIQVKVPVRYLDTNEGGVSHFHYLRDNLKLILLHFRLVPEFILVRILPFLRIKNRWKKL